MQRRRDAEVALDALRRLVQAIRVSSHAVEQGVGISGAQLFVLHELWLEPGASIRRLSERTLTDPSSVSVVVARLVARRLVTRAQHSTDARASSLTVSRQGARLLARAPKPFQARLIGALKELSPARLRGFSSTLTQLVEALGPTEARLFFEAGAFTKKKKKRPVRAKR